MLVNGSMNRGMMDHALHLDELDRRVIAQLRLNGRMPFKDIAGELGVSEGTIRNRTNRLIEQGVMRIVAVTDPAKLGYRLDCLIGLEVDPGQLEALTAKLSECEEVLFVGITVGQFDLLISGAFTSEQHLLDFLTRRLSSFDDIRRTQTSYVLKVIKRTADWTPPPAAGVLATNGS